MKITFILKDLSDIFFEGRPSDNKDFNIVGLNNLDDRAKLEYLFKKEQEGNLKITSKIGNGSFRDKVEFNQLKRDIKKIDYKIEARRGYKLATFEVF